MELPQHIKELYRHWDDHLVAPTQNHNLAEYIGDDVLRINLITFIGERMLMWQRKQQNLLPCTADPILTKYRFCNIFREFDKQTIAFHTLLNPLRDNFPLWLINMFMCRMIARPETIERIGFLSFNADQNQAWLNRLQNTPTPRYGNAYVFPISTIQRSSTPTRESFLAHHLPRVIPTIANEIASWGKQSVLDGLNLVLPIFGFNHRFLWTEVLIDVAYQYPQHIDLFKPFPIGPGSAPTMKRINASADPTNLVAQLATCSIDTTVTINGRPLRLSAENWEGIGCEFRKYTNLAAGHGRKRLYTLS